MFGRLIYFLKDFSPYILLVLLSSIAIIFGLYKISSSSLTQNKKKIAMAVVSTIFSMILVFTMAEAYFRYVYDESDGLGFLKVNARWYSRHVVYNGDYVRDRPFHQEKKEGLVRIGAFGDSLTFGAGIKDPENRFSNLLQKMLQSAGYNAEVYNLGRSGLDTEEEINFYKDKLHLNFDIIVWEYYLNDIQPENKSTGTTVLNSVSAPPLVKAISNFSYLFDYLYWRFSSQYQTTFSRLKNADINQYHNQEVLKKHIEEINNLVSMTKSNNQKFVVVIFPFMHLLGPNYPVGDIHQKMDSVFTEAGADAVIDLLPDLKDKNPKDLVASRFDSHPNEFVHKLAAEKLFEQIKPLLQR